MGDNEMRKYMVKENFARSLVRTMALAELAASLAVIPGCSGNGADAGKEEATAGTENAAGTDGKAAEEEKIRFFYDYEEMTARRDFIRENFGLS